MLLIFMRDRRLHCHYIVITLLWPSKTILNRVYKFLKIATVMFYVISWIIVIARPFILNSIVKKFGHKTLIFMTFFNTGQFSQKNPF